MQKYGRFGETPFYELDHESKMRLLKTHSLSSNGLAMEPGKREEKQLKETQTLQHGKPPIKNLPRTAGVAGRWRTNNALRQTNHRRHYDKANPCRNEGEHTGANAREKVCQIPPTDHWHGGG